MATGKLILLIGLLALLAVLSGCNHPGLETQVLSTDWISNDPHHQLGGCEEFISCPDGMKVLSGGIGFKRTTVDNRIFVKDSHPNADGTGWCHLVANDTDETIEYKVHLLCGQ